MQSDDHIIVELLSLLLYLQVGASQVHEHFHAEVLLSVAANSESQVARAPSRAPRNIYEKRLQRCHTLHAGRPIVVHTAW